MQNEPNEPMSALNVEQFDVWIFDSQGLDVSVIPHHVPWNVAMENYDIGLQCNDDKWKCN